MNHLPVLSDSESFEKIKLFQREMIQLVSSSNIKTSDLIMAISLFLADLLGAALEAEHIDNFLVMFGDLIRESTTQYGAFIKEEEKSKY